MNPIIYSWGKDGDDPEKSRFLQDFHGKELGYVSFLGNPIHN